MTYIFFSIIDLDIFTSLAIADDSIKYSQAMLPLRTAVAPRGACVNQSA